MRAVAIYGVNDVLVEVTGTITDASGNEINDAVLTSVNASGQQIAAPLQLSSNVYSAYTDQDPDTTYMIFSAKGYTSLYVPFSMLEENPNVSLTKDSSVPVWMMLAILAAIILVQKKKKKDGKVGAFGTADVYTVMMLVGGVIAFSIIRKVLEGLGLWNSKDTKALDNASTDPNSFWNPNYWLTIKPPDKAWTYAISEATADQWCDEIYNSFGAFNDDEEDVIGIFKRCRTKANCSFLAWAWDRYKGGDLLAYLRGGNWPSDRLSDKDVNTINSFISKLPNY
jgi:hypothetical protein